MSEQYKDRHLAILLDGTSAFKTAEDDRVEQEIAARLDIAWSCRTQSFGRMSPIDFWCERHGRMVGVVEVKNRKHTTDRYPTVFLSVRKWLSLQHAALGLAVPAVFVAQFIDDLRFINVHDIDASRFTVRQAVRDQSGLNDREPLIEVPVAKMMSIKG